MLSIWVSLSIRKEEGNDCVPFLLFHYTGCKFNGFIRFLPNLVFKLPLGFNSVFAAAALILYDMNVFVLAILIYLLYRFIAGFLIPVIRTTSHVRQQFNNMNKPPNQDDQAPNFQGSRPNAQGPTPNPQQNGPHPGTSKVGEYIDFEEVK
jgi:hypothetical protein